MAWSATATTMARAPQATRWFAQLQRVHQSIKTLPEQLVDLGHDAAQLRTIEMALHHVHNILHQLITLHLHDGSRVGADKQHHKIIA